MKVGLAQIAAKFLDREGTLERVCALVEAAGAEGCGLVAFGETLVPGYPFWLSRTAGSRFEDPEQKEWYGRYVEAGVDLAAGHLDPVCEAARAGGLAVMLGVAERAADRGGHSVFCSRLFIDAAGQIGSVHRKLMPTYEERLVWAAGDGAGLVTHRVGEFTVSGLNCWENWMPLARAALYAQGTDLHVMLWPGDTRLTRDITRYVAREGRCYVVSVGSLVRETDLPADLPGRAALAKPGEVIYDGGSAVAGPDGDWILEPMADHEGLLTCELDPGVVLRERQSFDPAGHYARPEVLELTVDRRRHRAARFRDS